MNANNDDNESCRTKKKENGGIFFGHHEALADRNQGKYRNNEKRDGGGTVSLAARIIDERWWRQNDGRSCNNESNRTAGLSSYLGNHEGRIPFQNNNSMATFWSVKIICGGVASWSAPRIRFNTGDTFLRQEVTINRGVVSPNPWRRRIDDRIDCNNFDNFDATPAARVAGQ